MITTPNLDVLVMIIQKEEIITLNETRIQKPYNERNMIFFAQTSDGRKINVYIAIDIVGIKFLIYFM